MLRSRSLSDDYPTESPRTLTIYERSGCNMRTVILTNCGELAHWLGTNLDVQQLRKRIFIALSIVQQPVGQLRSRLLRNLCRALFATGPCKVKWKSREGNPQLKKQIGNLVGSCLRHGYAAKMWSKLLRRTGEQHMTKTQSFRGTLYAC